MRLIGCPVIFAARFMPTLRMDERDKRLLARAAEPVDPGYGRILFKDTHRRCIDRGDPLQGFG